MCLQDPEAYPQTPPDPFLVDHVPRHQQNNTTNMEPAQCETDTGNARQHNRENERRKKNGEEIADRSGFGRTYPRDPVYLREAQMRKTPPRALQWPAIQVQIICMYVLTLS